MNKIISWLPKILGLAMIVFISLFALDVFSEGYSFWETIVALFMHLIPSYILIAVLIVAYKWSKVGGLLYLGLGLFYIIWFWERASWPAYLIISGPLFLIGILFLLQKSKLRPPLK